MKTRIQKWGNSLAVRIPKSFAKEMGWSENAPVRMSLEEGAMVIKTDTDRAWDLASLLDGITGENIHSAGADERTEADARRAADGDDG